MGAMDTPHEVAERLTDEAPDESWLRALVNALDQRLRTAPSSGS
jgi:hypothetical protein